ncbi:MAG: hypothetical protein ACR2ND_02545 [Solirubrobacteraceae bacterium]
MPRAILLALAFATLAAVPAQAARHAPGRHVPFGFLGVMADGALLDPARPLDDEFHRMAGSGVESVRFAAYWSSLQPYPNAAAVPTNERGRFTIVDGIPTDFSSTDRIVFAAARHGLRTLPVVFVCPPWARNNPAKPFSPPADPAAYGRFVGLLARRYGPRGAFWRHHPKLPRTPVHSWQIWNEPAGGATPFGPSIGWDDPTPFPRRYVSMLREARRQIKAVDPHGRVVLAGLFGASWLALRVIYRAHARGLFDAVAANVFTRNVGDVLYVVQRNRAVMNQYGDHRLPIYLTELSWPSSLGMIAPPNARDYEVTQDGQAQRVTDSLATLAAHRKKLGIGGLYWYSWVSSDAGDSDPFNYVGLRSYGPGGYAAKPAQAAYTAAALKLEGCRKLSSARRCAR